MVTKVFYRYSHLKLVAAIILGILFLDQLTKYLAKVYLQPFRSVSVIGDFFRLTFVENPGIAFGIRISNTVFFTALSIIAVLIIFYYLFVLRDRHPLRIAFAIILGGAFGNLIDRLLYGKVVDFLDFNFFNIHIPSFKILFFEFNGYGMNRWPVFNVADIAVSIGMIIIILIAIFDDENAQQTDRNAVVEND